MLASTWALRRLWTVSVSIWLATVIAALAATMTLLVLSDEGLEDAVASGLAAHVGAQVTLVTHSLQEQPLEVLGRLQGEESRMVLEDLLRELAGAAEAHDLALFRPDGRLLASVEGWVAGAAEHDLVAAAAAGHRQTGVLYEANDERLYQTAYAPVPDHPGWVVGIEASANLTAIEELERTQTIAAVVVVFVAGALGFGLAMLVSRPLRRLELELRHLKPGDGIERVSLGGPREARAVGAAVRMLLQAIRERDTDVRAAHQNEVDQLVRLSAEVAHEIRNPLHTLTLSVGRLVTVEDQERRRRIASRVHNQLGQLEVIVQRLLDLTRPLTPERSDIDLVDTVVSVLGETTLQLQWNGPEHLGIRTDPTMLTEVLRNLALNAEQAGATQISIQSVRCDEGVSLRFEDNGSGIPRGEVDLLFKWFHTTRAQGSGLGLPTSRRLATALGGRLACIHATPATFLLELPSFEDP